MRPPRSLPARLRRPLGRTALVLVVVLPIATAEAQSDDGGLLQRFLQNTLSSAGREVRISGFQGLLAGKAQLAELTIADDDGVWLILHDAVLDWNRAALLRGRLTVNQLTAGELVVVRRPAAAPQDVEAPKAEASGFALPQLPVEVRINDLGIDRVELGQDLVGQPAVLDLAGTMALAGGEGTVDIRANRIDGRDDHLALNGSFANDTRVLALNLALTEGPGGLAGTVLKLPGAPSLDLTVAGQGPLDAFDARLALATDGVDRITGAVTLAGDGRGGTDFAARLGGDTRPLIPAEFHDFFGPDLLLATSGNRGGDGALDLRELTLRAQSFNLHGQAQIGADNLPTAFELQGEIADADGGRVRLPLAGPAATLDRAQIAAHFDAAKGDGWDLSALVQGAERGGNAIGLATVSGRGTIRPGTPRAVTGDLSLLVDDLAPAEPGLAQATGSTLTAALSAAWADGQPVTVKSFRLDGADFGLTAAGELHFADRSLQLAGEAEARAQDLSRFSGLAGRPLTGQATVDLAGSGDPLGGLFDLTLDVRGEGLSVGQEAADNLLTEPVTISAVARRDTAGTELERFELRSRAVTADAAGKLGSGASDMTFRLALDDVGLVLPGREGALTLAGSGRETAPDDWQLGVDLDGPYDLTGRFDGRVHPGNGDITLDLSLPDIAPLVPGHSGPVKIAGTATEARAGQWQLDLDANGPYALTAGVSGVFAATGGSDLDLTVGLPDIAPLAPGFTGAVDLTANARQTAAGIWDFTADGSGPYQSALALTGTVGDGPGRVHLTAGMPDLAPLVPGFAGPIQAVGTASNAGDGRWKIDFDTTAPRNSSATVRGTVGGGTSDLALDIALADLAPFVPQLPGPLNVHGTAAENGDGRWRVDLGANGPFRSTATVAGLAGATGSDLRGTLAMPDVSPLAPGIRGGVNANLTAAQNPAGAWLVGVDAAGPYRSTVRANGQLGGGAPVQVRFDAALPDVSPLAPGISGPLTLQGTANQQTGGAWALDVNAGGPYRSTARVNGTVGAAGTSADIVVALPTLAPFAPGITGGMEARGNVAQDQTGIRLNLTTSGPQGAASTIAGTIAPGFGSMNLTARGAVPLGLANGMITPNAVDGTAQFDLALNGAPALGALSGTVRVSGARATFPDAGQSFTGIGLNATLANSAVRLDATATGQHGGTVTARGTVALTGAFEADLETRLNQFVLTDPLLYRTLLDGRVTLRGPLLGNAQIAGRINVGETEIRVPDGGLGFGATIPDVAHVAEPGDVFLTRKRAGLVATESAGGAGGSRGGRGPVYGLDVRIDVPGRVFIRGRGLDTEMGGNVRITGTTANVQPVGQIEVIRGRLEILGKRLDVETGSVTLGGGLTPYLDLTAVSKRDDFEFFATITGPVDDPAIALSSSPQLPEDEVLARFLFDRGLDDLSPLQAVQLANALAQLTGRGGINVLGNLRQGLGLDDLDLATTSDGDTELRAGRYLSKNVYTEFVADSSGETEIDINIDLHRNLTVRGSASSDGNSAIGIYWERDY